MLQLKTIRRRKNNMTAVRYSLIVLFIIAVNCIYSQENSNTPTLGIKQYLTNIEMNYPLFKKADNIIRESEYNLKAQRGLYDPFVKADYENKYFNSNNYYSVLSSEIKQPIFTSQYLKAGYEFGEGIYLNPESKTSSYGMPFLGFEASLLQGMLFDKRRASVLKAREYLKYGQAERNDIVNDVFLEASSFYAELSYVNAQLNIYNYFIQLAKTRNQGIIALAEIGEKPFIDTVEASITYQSRVLELQSLSVDNRKVAAIVNSFNWKSDGTVNTSFNFNIDSLELIFNHYKEILIKELNNDTINNPELQQYFIKQNIFKIEKRLKAEMIKPQLDVKYNFLSNNYNSLSPQLNSNNYKWGATLSFPLFLRTPRNEYKIAGLQFMNSRLETDAKSNELRNKVENYIKAISIISDQINNAQRNKVLSKRLLEAEKLKFDNGESSLFLLNMRENKWLEAEIKLNEYKLKFITSVLQLIHLKGNLNYK